ncbi:MAG: hypothetical protein R3C12_21505 [Planctomycetaceae bacterium]
MFNPKKMPGLHDPFAGGGTIPLEAQRLGLDAYASDLNPVAVLINKAMIEIPPKFAGMPPVNPESRADKKLVDREWHGAEGLAEDVRYYGKWMRDEAEKRIGHLYPKVEITDEMVEERPDLEPYRGKKLTIIAWLWARTVKSPNPAFAHIDVPLVNTFVLSRNTGKEVFLEPNIEDNGYTFTVKIGKPSEAAKVGTKAGRGVFKCIMSSTPIDATTVRESGRAARLGHRLLVLIAAGNGGKVFISPCSEHEQIARSVIPDWSPDVEFFQQGLGFRIGNYGLTKWSELFTRRQLAALSTFSSLVGTAVERIDKDTGDLQSRSVRKEADVREFKDYGVAVALYLGLAVGRAADYWSGNATWEPGGGFIGHTFTKHAVPMVWDFAESNPFSDATGNWLDTALQWIPRVIEMLPAMAPGLATQAAAQRQEVSRGKFISTDPPYYDNVGYADLSDYFYVWLRQTLRAMYPDLLATIAVPKKEELVATPARHGGREEAERFFLDGMKEVFTRIAKQSHPSAPITIYYAFKQADLSQSDVHSTGWETFLEAIFTSGLVLTGTWPVRTERPGRTRDIGSNALASSIVLVCRRRPITEKTTSRRDFIRELAAFLPVALDAMTRETEDLPSPVAPVDLSQAIIGPGMAIFSKYSAVLEADGSPMTVRTALQLINRFLAEDDFDADTQFCLHWFETHGWEPGVFGEADVLARTKATSVGGLDEAGVIRSGSGKVQLLKWSEESSKLGSQQGHAFANLGNTASVDSCLPTGGRIGR